MFSPNGFRFATETFVSHLLWTGRPCGCTRDSDKDRPRQAPRPLPRPGQLSFCGWASPLGDFPGNQWLAAL